MSLLARDRNGQVIQGITPIDPGQNITVGAASAACAATFAKDTTIIRMVSTVACHYAVGVNPVATAASALLPAGVVEFIGVSKGWKVAVIQDVGAGTANVTEGL